MIEKKFSQGAYQHFFTTTPPFTALNTQWVGG